MSKDEKENRINSFALTFLEKQQIRPNIFADQIIRGYKEGYHQAEKDMELSWEDIREICRMWIESKTPFGVTGEALSIEVLKQFKDYKERKEKMRKEIIKCDRCGEDISPDVLMYGCSSHIEFTLKYWHGGSMGGSEDEDNFILDLCDNCSKEFSENIRKWLKTK